MSNKTGLVLEGGAMRGMFTAGVLDVMMENGITFDGVMGVSAGAVFGCNYKSGQIGRSIRYNLQFCDDPRYCSVESLIRTGDLYGVDFCYNEIPVHFPGTGDIFSAILIGHLLNGEKLREATRKAMDGVYTLIDLNKDNEDKNRGIPLEQYLYVLRP